MALSFYSTLSFADITVRFPWDAVTGRIGLEIFPTALTSSLIPRRETLQGLPYIDAMPGAAKGFSSRSSPRGPGNSSPGRKAR